MALKTLERAHQQTPELDPPLPRWTGLEHRQQHNRTHRLLQLQRRKKLTPDAQAELDQLNQGRVITPPVSIMNPSEVA